MSNQLAGHVFVYNFCAVSNASQDPALWYRNGNCLVHLYGKGQSKRGPSFRLPFSELLAKKCYPLLERFLAPGAGAVSPAQLNRWNRLQPDQTVELYIPAPAMADEAQAAAYHVTTRNFFAWVFRKSMVGEHLGTALVGLLYSMHEFRVEGSDNVADLADYLEEEGYLGFVNQPNHALAILHLAETFEITDLYVKAFAHCAGMSDRLYTSEEYEVGARGEGLDSYLSRWEADTGLGGHHRDQEVDPASPCGDGLEALHGDGAAPDAAL